MKWIKDKIVISKKQAALYGVLFVIPCVGMVSFLTNK